MSEQQDVLERLEVEVLNVDMRGEEWRSICRQCRDEIKQLRATLASVRTVAERGMWGPPPSGACSDFEFILQLIDAK